MKILHLSTHDLAGGASRAAYRVHRCLLGAGLDSQMFVRSKTSRDPTVRTRTDLFGRFYFQLLPFFDRFSGKLLQAGDGMQRSFNLMPTLSLRRHVRPNDYDVVMLHFLGQGFFPPREIGRIKQPMVWLVHDMWPFCGAEHYTENDLRFRNGYRRENRPKGQRGLDLDRRLWQAKSKHWRPSKMAVIGASRWISGLAQESKLFANARHGVIPYPLDTRIYRRQDSLAARRLFNLPLDRKLVLFGAFGGLRDRRKGFDLLSESLIKLAAKRRDIELVVFGNNSDDQFTSLGMPCHSVGILRDEYSLAMLYSAVDVTVAPSRMDNLPQTVLESLCCGTPCVAFRVGGMPDMIEHQRNGFMASPYSTDELADGIEWSLTGKNGGDGFTEEVSQSGAALCGETGIAQTYIDLFRSLRGG